jgi:perosamine synthetase
MNDINRLALLGGSKIRTTDFRSEPMVNEEEIEIVVDLIKRKQFSKFVGSPIDSTFDILSQKSRELSLKNVSPNFLGGEYVRKLEALWSEITKSDYCISVNSATSGLTTALLALGLEPGSEVITTPFSFSATCAAIIAANCVPVFSDIDQDTFCLSPKNLKELITDKTKCVLTVHWCGNAGDLDQINSICKEKGVYLVEDAAQAPSSFYRCKTTCNRCDKSCKNHKIGSAVGTIGDVGVFSFNEPKNIMTGEGGLILTNSKEIAKKCRLIRNHGEAIVDDSFNNEELVNVIGYNFRLTELHAAIAYIQTKKRNSINKIRNENYQYLCERINNELSIYLVTQKITHLTTYYAYTAAFKWCENKTGVHRDVIADALIAEGIPVFKGYHRLMCDHPMFKRKIAFGRKHYPWFDDSINYNSVSVPNARQLVDNEFLGFLQTGYPNTKKDMDNIVDAFHKIITNIKSLKAYTAEKNTLSIGR